MVCNNFILSDKNRKAENRLSQVEFEYEWIFVLILASTTNYKYIYIIFAILLYNSWKSTIKLLI